MIDYLKVLKHIKKLGDGYEEAYDLVGLLDSLEGLKDLIKPRALEIVEKRHGFAKEVLWAIDQSLKGYKSMSAIERVVKEWIADMEAGENDCTEEDITMAANTMAELSVDITACNLLGRYIFPELLGGTKSSVIIRRIALCFYRNI